jgi:hypothetical protein
MRSSLATIVARGLPLLALAILCGTADCDGAFAATDGSYQDVYYVSSCETTASVNSAPIFSSSASGLGVSTAEACGGLGFGLQIDAGARTEDGSSGQWVAETPTPTIRLVGVTSQGVADCNLHADGFTAAYFYGDEGVNYGEPQITVDCGANANGQNSTAGDLNQKIPSSRYLGWQAWCGRNHSTCTPTGANGIVFAMTGITLEAQETSGPQLTADGGNNLYYQSAWVRGTFPANLSASDPSGVCAMKTTVNGTPVNTYADPIPDDSNWTQCPGGSLDATIDTTAYPNDTGAITLIYSATNAAGAASTATKTLNVDNQTPTISLAGPTDAPSTAGTQYVTATATAGPSGVAAIYCSVDGGAQQTYAGSGAQVPVSGIGAHSVSCFSQNDAVDASGQPAYSPMRTFDLSIRQPTAAAISFARIANALRCHTVTVKVRVPGRARTIRRRGKTILVAGRPSVVKRRVRRCRARTVRRKVTVIEQRHGKRVKVTETRRVVLLPHLILKTERRVSHGRATTVSGYLELANGTPLSGRPVQVLAAPNNGLGHFTAVATVTTASNGTWTAKVPAGPSRLIQAVYAGDSTTEPAGSTLVKLTVPARIAVSISPHALPWSRAMHIRGHLVGGYVPVDGVALRLLVRYPGNRAWTPLQALRTTRRGRFDFTWSYHAGRGTATYPFSIATTATESDYPFAAAASRLVNITFG